MVRHTQVVRQKVAKVGRVRDDQVQCVPPGVCGDTDMLLEVETVQ